VTEDIITSFKNVNAIDLPDFYNYTKPLEMGLWVLWVCKEKLHKDKLSAEEIAELIVKGKEISIDATSINNALNPAKGKRHIHKENGKIYFEIMKPGKDYLLSLVKIGSIDVFYFEPHKKFTSRILARNLLSSLKGELKIVDPYCGTRGLEILKELKQPIQFLTQLDKLDSKDKKELLQNLPDFKSEFPNIEIRNYSNNELHDRYIISDDALVIFGHSIKDLGNKESFAIFFRKDYVKNINESLIEVFNRRWKEATVV
jgi:hypothetical protein